MGVGGSLDYGEKTTKPFEKKNKKEKKLKKTNSY